MPETFFEAIRSAGLAALRVQLPRTPSLAGAVLPAAEAPRGVEGFTALHLAVDGGEVEVVRLLVSAGAELEARNGEGRTALHDSIEHGHRQIQELLIDAGAEVDVCAAAILGMEARLRELLDRDPGLATETSTGLSPLGWASYGNQTGTAAELVARGARPDDGELLCAASVGHVEVGRLLIEHGAEPNEIHPRAGGNALHAAAGMRYTCDSGSFVSMLLAAGADPGVRSRSGRTALEIAEEGIRRQAAGEAEAEQPRNFAGVAELLRAAAASAQE